MKIIEYNPSSTSSFVKLNTDDDYMSEDLSDSHLIITPISTCRTKPHKGCYQCNYGKPCSKHVGQKDPNMMDDDDDWELEVRVSWNTQGFIIYWDETMKSVMKPTQQYKAVLHCASCALFEFRIAVCSPRLVLS